MMSFFYYFLRKVKDKIKQKYTKTYETIYAIIDSKILINKNDKVLFIDLGSNLGQGYECFSKFFKGPNIHFELFEPNPYCYKKLIELKEFKEKKYISTILVQVLKMAQSDFMVCMMISIL